MTRPGLTTATQPSGLPLPEPMRVSAGFLVKDLSGKTLIQTLPPRLILRVMAMRAASIWRLEIQPASSDFSPYSPNCTVVWPRDIPRRRPRWTLRCFVRFGVSIYRPPPPQPPPRGPPPPPPPRPPPPPPPRPPPPPPPRPPPPPPPRPPAPGPPPRPPGPPPRPPGPPPRPPGPPPRPPGPPPRPPGPPRPSPRPRPRPSRPPRRSRSPSPRWGGGGSSSVRSAPV